MKRYVFLFIITSILFFSLAFKSAMNNNFPLFGRLIVVDAGHGGADPGSIYGNLYEKDYNLLMARNLKEVLENKGATVLMTRDGDYDLSAPNTSHRKKSDFDNRIKLINNSNADVYISLHMNYLEDNKYFGAQSFYTNKVKQNPKIAQTCQDAFNYFFDYDKPTKSISNDKYMYKELRVPGVLIEYGFMSNSSDRIKLRKESYRYELANVISNCIIAYFT